jgi:DNA modification methylase
MELNKIWNENCLDTMKRMEDKSVDLILTDPPYGINADKGVGGFGSSKTDNHYKGGWDNSTPPQEVFDEILRIGKKVIIFGGQFFADKLPTNGHWIVWDKKGDIAFDNPFGDCELAWTNINKKSVKKYKVIQQGFISEEKIRFHPTQKPAHLFKQIIEDYSEDGTLIYDPFLGSGTTALACKQLGRNYIGSELDKGYYDIALNRIANAQQTLL